MELTTDPDEMLDTVLRWFSMDVAEMSLGALIPRHAAAKDEALQNIIEVFPQLNSPEFLIYSDLILAKLVKDNHLIILNPQAPIAPLYSITFDGKLFSKNGGYQRQKLDKILTDEQTRIENRKNRLNQRILTWAAGLAGVGAVGLVIWEMYKYYHLGSK